MELPGASQHFEKKKTPQSKPRRTPDFEKQGRKFPNPNHEELAGAIGRQGGNDPVNTIHVLVSFIPEFLGLFLKLSKPGRSFLAEHQQNRAGL